MKKVFAFVLVLALVLLSLCAVAEDGGKKKIAFICKGYTDQFCLKVRNFFEEAVAANYADKFDVEYFDSELNATTQINQIETCTYSGFDAIIFQQVDAEAPVEAVKNAVAAGVAVVVTVGQVNDNGESHFIDANPYQQGEALINFAMDGGYCDNAEIGILCGVTGNFHAESRLAAFRDGLATKEDATLVATEYCDWGKDRAMTTTQNWLVAYPDIDVVIASCDDMAMGAIEAIEMAGKQDQVKVFSIDGTDVGIQAVAEGRLMCTVQQDGRAFAELALEMADKLLNGQNPESLQIASTLITAENVADFM